MGNSRYRKPIGGFVSGTARPGIRLTLFRLGFFGQSVTGGGAPRIPPPLPSVSLEPIMLGS